MASKTRIHEGEDDPASNDAPDRTFSEALAQVATQRGTLENVKDDTGESEGLAEPASGGPSVRIYFAVELADSST